MRLISYAKQPVQPRDFWTAIAAVSVLLGIMGVCIVPLEHFPANRWIWGAALLAVWGVNLWRLFRFGRLALPWSQAVLLVGLTLLSAHEVWPRMPAIVSWIGNAGISLAMVGLLAPYLAWGRQPKGDSNAG